MGPEASPGLRISQRLAGMARQVAIGDCGARGCAKLAAPLVSYCVTPRGSALGNRTMPAMWLPVSVSLER